MKLYLQEKTRIIGMHPNRGLFSKAMANYSRTLNDPEKSAPMRNLGIWELVGMTGEWATVLGLYEFCEGWDSFTEMTAQIMRVPPPELAAIYRTAEERRSGGSDEILEALEGSPTYADLLKQPGGNLLVVDEIRVKPGDESRYGEAVLDRMQPLAIEAGRRLIGLYKGALTDGLVLSYWATTLEQYAKFNGSHLFDEWRRAGRDRRLSWRQELWTAPSS